MSVECDECGAVGAAEHMANRPGYGAILCRACYAAAENGAPAGGAGSAPSIDEILASRYYALPSRTEDPTGHAVATAACLRLGVLLVHHGLVTEEHRADIGRALYGRRIERSNAGSGFDEMVDTTAADIELVLVTTTDDDDLRESIRGAIWSLGGEDCR